MRRRKKNSISLTDNLMISSFFFIIIFSKAKTRVLRKTNNPIYNEEFTFFGIAPNMLEKLIVHFSILNFDRFSRDDLIGEIVCHLNQFEFDSLEKQISLCKEIKPIGSYKVKNK